MNALLSKELLGLAALTASVVFIAKWQILPRLDTYLALREQVALLELEQQVQEADLLPVLEARLKQAAWMKQRFLAAPSSSFSKDLGELIANSGASLWLFRQEDRHLWYLECRGTTPQLTALLHSLEQTPICKLVERAELDGQGDLQLKLLFRMDYDAQENLAQ